MTNQTSPIMALVPIGDFGTVTDYSHFSTRDILSNPEKSEWLLYVADNYEELLKSSLHACLKLKKYKEIVYLIDFDVLRDYLEGRVRGRFSNLNIESIFYRSKIKFAIPSGAALELLDYIADIALFANNISRRLDEFKRDLSRREFIDCIVNYIGLHDGDEEAESKNESESDTVVRILQNLDQRYVILTRLYRLLTHDRFIGIVSTHNTDDLEVFQDILVTIPRGGREGPRTKVDYRDALNLSVAIKSYRDSQQSEAYTSPQYLLISRTSIVLELAKHIKKNIDNSNILLERLCVLLNTSQSQIDSVYPVIDPDHITG